MAPWMQLRRRSEDNASPTAGYYQFPGGSHIENANDFWRAFAECPFNSKKRQFN
jgi:hypothetical protein